MNKTIVAILVLIFSSAAADTVHAKLFHSDLYKFSIEMPNDWTRTKPKKTWTLVSFAKLGSGENININVQNAQGYHSVKQFSLKDTFYPFYDKVHIFEKYIETVKNEQFRHCIYQLKDSDIKRQIEGNNRLRYYTIQWVRDENLFTITFTDSGSKFEINLKTFRGIYNSLSFDK